MGATTVDRFPVTPMQQSMLVASLRDPQARPYVVQVIGTLHEALDVACLQEAWRRVTEAHAVFQTRFFLDDQLGLVQQVSSEVVLDWELQDWRGQPRREQEERLEAWLEADLAKGFALDGVSYSRVRLLRWAETDYRLVWTNHHALFDGRARLIILKEWFACYEALRDGRDFAFEPSRSFRDHVDWLHTQDWTANRSFWKEQLAGLSEPTRLAHNGPNGIEPGPSITAKHKFTFSEVETGRLEAFARKEGITMNTLVQGAWALLLSRYARRETVVFGATRACRYSSLEGAEGIVGPLINTVPLRVAVPQSAALRMWLKALRSQWVGLRPYEHTPLPLIQSWSEMPPGTPPFESVLVYDHMSLGTALQAQGGAWLHRHVELRQQTDGPLTLTARGQPLLEVQIAYDRRRIEDGMAQRMVGHLHALLNGFADNPDAALADLSLLTPEEHRAFATWNATAAAYPRDRCLHELFEMQARSRPEAIALVAGAEVLTYGELNRRANRLARRMREEGVGPEVLVGLCLARSPEIVIGLLAILKAGGAFMPLDPGLPTMRLHAMLEDAAPHLVLTQQAYAEALAGWQDKVLVLEQEQDDLARRQDDDLATASTAEALAYAIYTSGSTGKPKGVLVTHRAIVNHTLASCRHFGITPRDRRLQFGAVTTDFFIAEVANYLTAGATLVLRSGEAAPSVAAFLQDIDTYGITVVGVPSTYWHEWVAALDLLPLPNSLRLVITGMEKVQVGAYARWRQRVSTRVRWCNVYGPTEATCTSTVYEAGSSDPGLDAVPIGKPIANVTAYVLGHDGNQLPVGVPGELYIGGDGVARGYLNRPALTAERFVPDPFGPSGARLYRTGDLVYRLPDGNLVFLGRVDRQIKIRGNRVEPGEIESVLAGHPAVGLAAVVAYGEDGDTWLAGYYTGAEEIEPDMLRQYLAQHLPGYMVPSVLVPLEVMPLAQNQKIDRAALPVPERGGAVRKAPRTPLEENLVAMWGEILGAGAIGVEDDFFALGGDSLKAMKLALALQRTFGVEIPVQHIFDRPTIAQLADEVLITFAEREQGG